MQNPSTLYIGIMSGTSVDGIDVALVDISAEGTSQFLDGLAVAFAPDLREEIMAMCAEGQASFCALGRVGVRLGRAFGQAVNQLLKRRDLCPSSIRAIGCHGQTLFHAPSGEEPFSMQVVNAAELAKATGITTITDFRSMDVALGGQGAPLVPLFHQSLVSQGSGEGTLVYLNIGGIANISIIRPLPLLGFDTGPGNVLLDAWATHTINQPYDADGTMATSGTVQPTLLTSLLADPYFAKTGPKSTGRELFNFGWLQRILNDQDATYRDEDVMATLAALTANSIADSIRAYPPGNVLVCGGGSHNPFLMSTLSNLLPQWTVRVSTELGVDADFMEAMAFAWFAHRCLHRLPGTDPSVTGSSRQEIAGSITQVSSHPLVMG